MRQKVEVGKEIALLCPLPEQTKTYSVIPHETVLKVIDNSIQRNNFSLTGTRYISSHMGRVFT